VHPVQQRSQKQLHAHQHRTFFSPRIASGQR